MTLPAGGGVVVEPRLVAPESDCGGDEDRVADRRLDRLDGVRDDVRRHREDDHVGTIGRLLVCEAGNCRVNPAVVEFGQVPPGGLAGAVGVAGADEYPVVRVRRPAERQPLADVAGPPQDRDVHILGNTGSA